MVCSLPGEKIKVVRFPSRETIRMVAADRKVCSACSGIRCGLAGNAALPLDVVIKAATSLLTHVGLIVSRMFRKSPVELLKFGVGPAILPNQRGISKPRKEPLPRWHPKT